MMAAPDGAPKGSLRKRSDAVGDGESQSNPGGRSRRRSVGPRGRRNSLSSNEGSGGMTAEAIAAMATADAAGSSNRNLGPRPTSPDDHARRPRDRQKSDTFMTGGNGNMTNNNRRKRRSSTKKFKRRGSVTIDSATGCFRQRFGISKRHVEIFNKQLDRDEPERHFVKSLIATGTVNLGELSEVGGADLLGYPDGNEKGETRAFMLALS